MGRRGAIRATIAALAVASLGPLCALSLTHPTSAAAEPAPDLATAKQRLDDLALRRGAPPEVTAWWADPASGTVVLAVHHEPRDARGADWMTDARAIDPRIRVRQGVDSLTPRAAPEQVVGGDAIYLGRERCSVGFGARTLLGAPRMITAGHCTREGGEVRGTDGTAVGPVRSSVFDRDGDWGVVDVGPGWTPTAQVADADSDTLRVTGSATPEVGAPVCRSGSTTGWHCGTVTALDVTANYATGPVLGLTLTSACSEPGDSGGPFTSGGSALGVLSGGSGTCASPGGTTLFQPIDEVLVREGLELATG